MKKLDLTLENLPLLILVGSKAPYHVEFEEFYKEHAFASKELGSIRGFSWDDENCGLSQALFTLAMQAMNKEYICGGRHKSYMSEAYMNHICFKIKYVTTESEEFFYIGYNDWKWNLGTSMHKISDSEASYNMKTGEPIEESDRYKEYRLDWMHHRYPEYCKKWNI